MYKGILRSVSTSVLVDTSTLLQSWGRNISTFLVWGDWDLLNFESKIPTYLNLPNGLKLRQSRSCYASKNLLLWFYTTGFIKEFITKKLFSSDDLPLLIFNSKNLKPVLRKLGQMGKIEDKFFKSLPILDALKSVFSV